jgi:DNA-binding transcriptional regulator LsrR (DeoR family)
MDQITYDKRLLVRCAKLHYEDGVSQVVIAERLGLSKSTISRILTKAKEAGIVKFLVESPIENDFTDLERKLENTFGLLEAIVVEETASIEALKESLAFAGARYLERIIRPGFTIGATWGTTVSKVPKYIELNRDFNITVVPLTGGLGSVSADIHPNQIATKIAEKFKTTAKLLHAPGMVKTVLQKESFLKEASIKEVVDHYDHLDIILTGIGSPSLNSSTMLASKYYQEEELQALVQKRATADIGNLILDKDGCGDDFENNQRVIGINLSQFKKTPFTVGIAGGAQKVDAIYAALKGGFINTLIIDNHAADRILYKHKLEDEVNVSN